MADRLDFGFEGGPALFHNIRMELHAGRILGIAGESGCGKTTLIKILCGLYKAPGAVYEADGKKRESLAGLTAAASGERQLFRMSIYDNIALGDPSITREECASLLERLGFGEWVNSLPEKIDTIVAPDSVSGGQRQAVSNARALLSRFPAVILDEPYSALDAEKEELLTAELERCAKDRIIVLTSHRPGTLKCCDDMLKLDIVRAC